MKKAWEILYILLICIVRSWFSYATEYLSFNTFLDDIRIKTIDEPNLSYQDIQKRYEDIKDHTCYIENFDTQSYISPACLYDKDNLNLTTEYTLSFLLNDLEWFMDTYKENSYNFYYYPTQPIYNDDLLNRYIPYYWSTYEQSVLIDREKENKIIVIPNEILSKIIYRWFSFYVVPTYLANRWPCSLQNYKIAIEKLDRLVLMPWEELYLNNLIKNNPKSCKGSSSQNYLFYWWSCGSSTQLFRLSLIMPKLTVIERHNHSKWWALYYWENIMWDDAAMYQNSEKFIVRNDFDTPIYFMVYEQGDYSYLIGIIPDKIKEYVEIFKKTLGLNSSVFKRIFDNKWDILNYQVFNSHYLQITRNKA